MAPWLEFSSCIEGHTSVMGKSIMLWSIVVIYLSTLQNIDIAIFEPWDRNL